MEEKLMFKIDKMNYFGFILKLLGTLGVYVWSSSAFSNNCQIIPQNRIISKSGCYYLDRNIMVNGNKPGVTISANNVDLDLNKMKIYVNKAKNNSYGILVTNSSFIHIYNGSIENTYYGIVMTNVKNGEIYNIKFHKINNIAITLSYDFDIKIINNTFALNSLYDKNDDINFYLVGVNAVSTERLIINKNNFIYKNPLNITDNPKLEQLGILLSSENRNVDIIENNINLNTLRHKTYGLWCAHGNKRINIKNNKIVNNWYGMALLCKDTYVIGNKIVANHSSLSKFGNQFYYRSKPNTFEEKTPFPTGIVTHFSSINRGINENSITGYNYPVIMVSD